MIIETIMPGGQDPALLMIRCSVCICARRREDDSSVLIALGHKTYETIFVVLATCGTITPPPRPSYLRLNTYLCESLSISLFLSRQSLIHLHFAIVSQPTTLTVLLG